MLATSVVESSSFCNTVPIAKAHSTQLLKQLTFLSVTLPDVDQFKKFFQKNLAVNM